MTTAKNITLYRGTTEAWELAVMEAMQVPPKARLSGTYGERMLRVDKNFNKQVNERINHTFCSQLRSGKEIVLGKVPTPFNQLAKQQIEQELVARVGVETAAGTANFYSHFVPCGTESGISTGFGKGQYYEFEIYGAIFANIDDYWIERNDFQGTPLFKGGKNEVLAYTGTVILSVRHVTAKGSAMPQSRTIMNSLD